MHRLSPRLLRLCLWLLAGWLSLSTPGGAQTLYVSSGTTSGTVKIVTSGGTSTGGTLFASGFSNPRGIAFDRSGNLYVANGSNGTVNKVTPDGTVSTFATGVTGAFGLVFDSSGNLYVSTGSNNSIVEVTPGGVQSTFLSGGSLSAPRGMAFDSSGNLYVANGSGTVSEYSSTGTLLDATFASGLTNLFDVAFDSSGNLYVTSAPSGNNTVVEITPGGVQSTFVTAGTDGFRGLAFDDTGNLYVASSTLDTIAKYSSTGTLLDATFASGFSGGDFYIAVAPVPEPSSYAALTGLAALGLVWYRRRRRR